MNAKRIFAVLLVTIAHLLTGDIAAKELPKITKATILELYNESGETEHPRLLIDAAGFDRVKNLLESDPKMQRWHGYLIMRADALLEAPLKAGRNLEQDLQTLSLAYKLGGEEKYKARVHAMVKAAFELPNWGQGFKLDASARLNGVAIAYDWLYHDWDEKTRAWFRDGMQNLGFSLYHQSVEDKVWWLGENFKGGVGYFNNHNAVCNTGPVLAALAVIDHPEFRDEAAGILATAFSSMRTTLNGLSPDGAWDEGPGYYGYALSHLVDSLASLENTLGTDFGYLRHPGLQKTPSYLLQVNGPAGAFNYGDGLTRKQLAPYLYWMGERMKSNDFAYQYSRLSDEAQHLGRVQSLLYYNPKFEKEVSQPELDAYFGQSELVTLRSAWGEDALYLAAKGGKGATSHGNADVGHVVFHADGVQWFVDLGAEPYTKSFFQYETTRYDYYRAKPEGHSTLVLNPGHEYQQDIKQLSTAKPLSGSAAAGVAEVDLTPAYAKHATQVKRRVALLANRKVGLIQDRVMLKQAGDVFSFFVSYADIEVAEDKQSAILKQNGQSLAVHLLQPAGGTLGFGLMDAVALAQSKKPDGAVYQSQGIQKLVLNANSVEELEYAILLVPGSQQLKQLPEFQSLDQWTQASREPYLFKLESKSEQKPRVLESVELELNPAMFSASDLAGTALDAALLLDGNPYSYWHAKAEAADHSEFKPAELVVDLGKVQSLAGISTQWVTAYQRAYRFRVMTSVDGNNWKQQFWGVNRLHDPLQKLNFQQAVDARYLKLLLTGDLRGHSKLSELRVNGY